MVRAVERYPAESIVLVKGRVQRPPQPIKTASIHDAEVVVHEIHLISHLTENVPFTVYDAENILHLKTTDEDSSDEETGTSTPRKSMQSSRSADSDSDEQSRSRSGTQFYVWLSIQLTSDSGRS